MIPAIAASTTAETAAAAAAGGELPSMSMALWFNWRFWCKGDGKPGFPNVKRLRISHRKRLCGRTSLLCQVCICYLPKQAAPSLEQWSLERLGIDSCQNMTTGCPSQQSLEESLPPTRRRFSLNGGLYCNVLYCTGDHPSSHLHCICLTKYRYLSTDAVNLYMHILCLGFA